MAFDRAAVTTRGFWGTWLFICQRHLGLLTVFVCCIAIVFHIIVSTLPSFIPVTSEESLLNLAEKTKILGQQASPAPVVTFAGFTLSDNNDWLNPSHLGLREIERSGAGAGSLFFDATLWDKKFAFTDKSGKPLTSKALPTNAWWQPWVMPPGQPYSVA